MEDEAGQIKLLNTMVDRHFHVDIWNNAAQLIEHLVKENIIKCMPGSGHFIVSILEDFSISARVGNISTLSKGATFPIHDLYDIFDRHHSIDLLHKSL